jgi:hypothetical protein
VEITKTSHGNSDINEVLEAFTKLTGLKLTNIKRQRQFASTLLRREAKADILSAIEFVAGTMDDKYAPRVADIEKLYYKWGELQLYGRKKRATYRETTLVDLSTL